MTVRAAFVGQATFFEACSPPDEGPGGTTRFFEFRAGGDAAALVAALERFAPEVVVVFRPEIIPQGLLRDLDATTLGFLTEPLPRGRDEGVRAAVAGSQSPLVKWRRRRLGSAPVDLERRRRELAAVDPGNFDRVMAFDPNITATAEEFMPVWRSVPLPAADRYFKAVAEPRPGAQPLFVGRSTPHREAMLVPAKHRHDVLHLAFGVGAAMLEDVLDRHWLALNVHNEPYPTFENRMCLHLAAGHLVLSEPLDPAHGLEPGADFLEVRTPDDVLRVVGEALGDPALHHGVRVRGRAKADRFRASAVWPGVLHDLLAELRRPGARRRGR